MIFSVRYKYKNKFLQNCHYCKIRKGQLRVIINIKCVELEFIMLRDKFHDHGMISSVAKDFLRFLP